MGVCRVTAALNTSQNSLDLRQWAIESHYRSLGGEDLLKEGTATHSSILAWRIPWTEEPDRLQSMASQRVVHD